MCGHRRGAHGAFARAAAAAATTAGRPLTRCPCPLPAAPSSQGSQPSSGNVYEEDLQRAVADALTLAELEKEFIKGEAGSEETAAYLEAVAADKFEAFLDAAANGSNAAIVEAVVSAAADAAEAQGVAVEVEPEEEYSPAASPDDAPDPLALYDNETAADMRQLVAAAKLTPEELVEGMVPEVGRPGVERRGPWACRQRGGHQPAAAAALLLGPVTAVWQGPRRRRARQGSGHRSGSSDPRS
jgi:hypothetical protein